MDLKQPQNTQKSRFAKLTLKKNRPRKDEDIMKINRSSDIVILDDSFERLKLNFPNVQSTPKLSSPIVINDSSDFDEDLPKVSLTTKQPSKSGNVSFNCSKQSPSSENVGSRPSLGGWSPAQNILCAKQRVEPTPSTPKDVATPSNVSFNCSKQSPSSENVGSRPSLGGWSPAQNILCAKQRVEPTPSTPKDVANESLEKCSIKKIHHSQKKLLDDIYGEVWKSIPTLFKTISHKQDDLYGVSKKLDFDDDDDSDKENVRLRLKENKKLYLTGSERKLLKETEGEKNSKKKLFTEKIINTPQPKPPPVQKNLISTSKKKLPKGKSVTELVEYLEEDVDSLVKRVNNVALTPESVKRLTFMGSLADNVPSWRCHIEALQYRDNYKALREQLTRRLFDEFNRVVFGGALDNDLPITWDSKLRSTAGTTTNRLIKTSCGSLLRTSSIRLSSKVLDSCARARDTLAHELCHAATWLLDAELRAGHGPLWKKWASKALRAIPELGEISRCHNLEIHFKYSYKCTKCGYCIKRHSKSIDVTKKCCGYCRGTFEVIVNKKNKDGVVVSTPARKGEANEFAKFVKDNYSSAKTGRTHAQVMKVLGEQFSAKKKPKE